MTVMMMMVIASRCTFPIGEQSDETRAVSGKKMHSFDNCFCWDWGKTTLRNKSPTIPLPKSFVANPNMPIEPHLTVFEKKIEREASTLQKLSPLIRSSFFFGPAKKKTLSVSQYQRMVGRAASNLFKEISSSIHIIFCLLAVITKPFAINVFAPGIRWTKKKWRAGCQSGCVCASKYQHDFKWERGGGG